MLQRRSVFESLGILLGIEEGTWDDRELHEYLDAVARSGQIEGAYDSDNKARAIVRRWKESVPGFDLLPRQKVLLIREMLDGPTLGEDEEAILDLLELSDASDLRAMFAADGLALGDLESDIDGDNRTRLDSFVSSRFAGGRDALLAGRVEVVGDAVPAGAPRFGFDPATPRRALRQRPHRGGPDRDRRRVFRRRPRARAASPGRGPAATAARRRRASGAAFRARPATMPSARP